MRQGSTMGGAITERPSLLHMGTALWDEAAARAFALKRLKRLTATSKTPRRRTDPDWARARNRLATWGIAVVISAKTRAVYLGFFVSQSGAP